MNYNSLHAAGQVWGAIILLTGIVWLLCIGAWPVVALLAVMTALVGWAEHRLRPDLYE